MAHLGRRTLVLSVLLAALGSVARAQLVTPVVERQQKPRRLTIKAGRLLDVRTGQTTPNVFILIEGDRIARVGGSAPSGVTVIDLSGLTVLPGLIDAHDHILGNPKDWSATAGLRMSAPQATLWGVRNL